MSENAWSTWGHRHDAEPNRVFKPRSVAEAQDLIKQVAASGGQIKVVGASRSSSAIAQPTDTMLSLDNLVGLTGVSSDHKQATFLAGTTVQHANKALATYGLAFENLGRLGQQTLAGAVSTGTHGTGLGFGIMPTQVTALTLLTSTGELVECSAERNPEIFRAALVGLGALGILTSITFRVVPSFRIHASERARDFNEIVPTFIDRSRGSDHYEFSWFPDGTQVRTRRLTRLPLLTEGFMEPSALISQARRHGRDYALNNGIFEVMNFVATRAPSSQKLLNKVSNLTSGNRRYADLSPTVFILNRTVRQNNMEYAFELQVFEELMKDLKKHLEKQKVHAGYPIVVRTAAADDIPLSQAYGRETVFISAREYWRRPFEEYFTGLESVFKDYGGRPHWGQMHSLDAADLEKLYPEFSAFTSLREEMDPDGLFLNPYLRKVLLP